MNTAFELMGGEGVAEVVDFGVFDAGFFEIAVDGGANVSDQEGMSGFGDEKMVVFDLRSYGKIVLQGG